MPAGPKLELWGEREGREREGGRGREGEGGEEEGDGAR